MEPFRIYRDEWARALSAQLGSPAYTIFVAMPFREHFSYRSQDILQNVIGSAAAYANAEGRTPRPFSPPRCVAPEGASVITDEIVRGILESHIFVGDLTFENAGVLIETGIALATKPIRQVVLITQGSHADLHFDVRNNNVVCYSPGGSVAAISAALIGAASHCEEQLSQHIVDIVKRLSPDAVIALKYYGFIQSLNRFNALHAGNPGPHFEGSDGRLRFDAATKELRVRDLVWTEYAVAAFEKRDAYGMHATPFGWAIIERMWPEYCRVGT